MEIRDTLMLALYTGLPTLIATWAVKTMVGLRKDIQALSLIMAEAAGREKALRLDERMRVVESLVQGRLPTLTSV